MSIVNQSISSRTQRATHASSLSAEHGVHSTARRGSSLGSNLSERSHKTSVAHTSVGAKANSNVRSSRDSQRGPSQSVNRTVRQAASKKVERKWSKNDLPADENNFLRPRQRVNAETKNARPITFFEDFFDAPILNHICQQSMLYAAFKGNDRFKVQPNEIRAFVAILIGSGYVDLPRRRMFWEQASDVDNELACSLMSRDRFQEIMKYIHFNDNTQLDPEDKYSKVRPLMDHLNMKFVDTFCGEEELDVDESMVPCYGRHGCKQFIRNKPIHFGYKIWCLNAPLGYLVKFIPYQEKGSVTDKELGLGGSVVVDLLSVLSEEDKYKVYFDNFFTSLVDKLTEKKIGATGTVRENRIEKCPITGVKEMKKKERGTYDYQYDDQKKLSLQVEWQQRSNGCLKCSWSIPTAKS